MLEEKKNENNEADMNSCAICTACTAGILLSLQVANIFFSHKDFRSCMNIDNITIVMLTNIIDTLHYII